MNLAIVWKKETGGMHLIKDISVAYNSNLLRDWFGFNDIGYTIRQSEKDTGSLDDDAWKKWIADERNEKKYIKLEEIDSLITRVKNEKRDYEDRIKELKEFKIESVEVYERIREEIEQLKGMYNDEDGCDAIIRALISLHSVAQYVAEDYFAHENKYFLNETILICWWLG